MSQITGEYFGTLSSHTGTLDPMAGGVVIVLLGEERFKKYEYAHWLKTYEFEVIFGVSTDSYDALGYITEKDGKNPTRTDIDKILPSFIGSYSQHVPMYSAVKVKGRKLFERARNGEIISKTPVKKGEILKLKLIKYEKVGWASCIKRILAGLRKIEGDFRQEGIIGQWEGFLADLPAGKKTVRVKFRAEMTKGLYVRTLSQDICKKLGCRGFVYTLIRTKNGSYTRKNALKVEKLFGSEKNFRNLMLGRSK